MPCMARPTLRMRRRTTRRLRSISCERVERGALRGASLLLYRMGACVSMLESGALGYSDDEIGAMALCYLHARSVYV